MANCTEPGAVNYTDNIIPIQDGAWNSQPFFEYNLFNGFHKAANECLAWIFPDYEQYTGYRINPDDLLDFSEDNVDVNEMIYGNRGPLTFAVIGVIFAAVITIFGIGWCCVKLCSCCKKKKTKDWDRYNSGQYDEDDLIGRTPREKRREKRIRTCCGVTLIIWILLSGYSLVAIFVMNDQLRDGINDAKGVIDNSLADAELYLNSTSNDLNAIFVTSYDELAYQLICILDAAPPNPKATTTTDNAEIGKTIELFQEFENNSLLQIQKEDELLTTLSSIQNRLTQYCELNSNGCPDQTNSSEAISSAITKVGDLRSILDRMRTDIARFGTSLSIDINISKPIEYLREKINSTRDQLGGNYQDLADAINEVVDNVKDARQNLNDVEEEFDKVNPHLHSSILVICIFLVVISLLFLVGAIASFFGKSKTANNKPASFSLNCGIFTIFLFGGILWIFVMACFLLSGALTQVLPAALRSLESNESDIYKPRHVVGRNSDIYELPNYRHIAYNCKNYESAYVTFNLSQVYNIEGLKNLSDAFAGDSKSRKIGNAMDEIFKDFSTKHPTYKSQLESLQTGITNLGKDLDQIIVDLKATILASEGTEESEALTESLDSLENLINQLQAIRTNGLTDQGDGINSLNNILASVQIPVQPFNDLGEEEFKKFLEHVTNYSDFAYNAAYYDVGQCRPMYNALNSTINLFSYKIGSPIAGFWFGLNTVMLLFFPTIITAIVLHRV